ncbi:hypothetical protein [Streptomyces sp. NPDC021020]|uniref:hypothetical protein n=1 Tax=Streptomyces sp. NPDC021020 TaxID=3365109 RepID=UPI0037B92FA8
MKFAKRAAIAAGAAALGVVVASGTAQADPPTTTPPTYRTLVGVGSDTTQDVMNGLANGTGDDQIFDTNPGPDSDGLLIASYDATPAGTIQVGAGCSLPRPDGSGAGVKALRLDIAANTNCLDFARSSSAPNASGQFTFIPFGVDAVTAATATVTNLPGNYSFKVGGATLPDSEKAQYDLNRVYNCLDTSGNKLADGVYPTIGGVTVHPLVPQDGSGTRKFWASTLGFDPAHLPSCVKDVAANGDKVQEHNGSALQGPNDLMPFSIAQYIAQGRSLPGVTNRRNGAVLATVNGTSTTVTGGNLNSAFPINREVYNVVQDSRVTETNIATTFVGSGSDVCSKDFDFANGTSYVNAYGFGTDPNCGDITLSGKDLI